MRARRTGLPFVVLFSLGVGVGSPTGCDNTNVAIFIRQVQAPVPGAGVCTIPPDPMTRGLNEGTLDLALARTPQALRYILHPLFQTEITSRRDIQANRPETNGIFIEGFVIQIYDSDPSPGHEIGRPFTVFQTVFVPPGMGGQPGFGTTDVEIIPSAVIHEGGRFTDPNTGECVTTPTRFPVNQPIDDPPGVPCEQLPQHPPSILDYVCRPYFEPGINRQRCPVPDYSRDRLGRPARTMRLIVHMIPFGRTMGGVSIEAPPFDYPVSICCGCLVQFPGEANAPESEMGHYGPDCLASGTVPAGPALCSPGQDFPQDCRGCNSLAACQPPGFVNYPQGPMSPMPPTLDCPSYR
ncbi:MAG: hypothetical protein HY909_19495 [Deltaproteobacteria bacterium]|nr:hypothetical protein [Deltaproteobacteria bacterium]